MSLILQGFQTNPLGTAPNDLSAHVLRLPAKLMNRLERVSNFLTRADSESHHVNVVADKR
jgi:hypothetical protein